MKRFLDNISRPNFLKGAGSVLNLSGTSSHANIGNFCSGSYNDLSLASDWREVGSDFSGILKNYGEQNAKIMKRGW